MGSKRGAWAPAREQAFVASPTTNTPYSAERQARIRTNQNALQKKRTVEYPALEKVLQVTKDALEAAEKAKHCAQAQHRLRFRRRPLLTKPLQTKSPQKQLRRLLLRRKRPARKRGPLRGRCRKGRREEKYRANSARGKDLR